VTDMAGLLLDHVEEHLARRHLAAVTAAPEIGPRVAKIAGLGDDPLAGGDLLPPDLQGLCDVLVVARRGARSRRRSSRAVDPRPCALVSGPPRDPEGHPSHHHPPAALPPRGHRGKARRPRPARAREPQDRERPARAARSRVPPSGPPGGLPSCSSHDGKARRARARA
jgi:hypothetical protein